MEMRLGIEVRDGNGVGMEMGCEIVVRDGHGKG